VPDVTSGFLHEKSLLEEESQTVKHSHSNKESPSISLPEYKAHELSNHQHINQQTAYNHKSVNASCVR